jgi:hypothetical protein
MGSPTAAGLQLTEADSHVATQRQISSKYLPTAAASGPTITALEGLMVGFNLVGRAGHD